MEAVLHCIYCSLYTWQSLITHMFDNLLKIMPVLLKSSDIILPTSSAAVCTSSLSLNTSLSCSNESTWNGLSWTISCQAFNILIVLLWHEYDLAYVEHTVTLHITYDYALGIERLDSVPELYLYLLVLLRVYKHELSAAIRHRHQLHWQT